MPPGPVSASPPVLSGGPVQLAYLVADVETAAQEWTRRFGAGPFFVRHHIEVSDVLIDGRPSSFDHSSAYGQWGSMMVELVAVHRPAQLAVTATGVGGLHHVAYFVESFDGASEALSDRGWPRSLVATAGSTRFAFHDARAELGHLVEIYQRAPALQRFYDMVAQSAVGWDGADPLRRLG